MQLKNLAVLGVSAAIAAVGIGAGGSAYADSLLGSAGIRDNSVRSVDVHDGSIKRVDLSDSINRSLANAGKDGATGPQGPAGADGKAGVAGEKGEKGDSGLAGAFYATALYNAGNTNAGAIATVACDPTSTAYTAISGGVQVLGLDAEANGRNTPVSSSFPGRMDWSTNAPREGRLDGWIVQFGGNAGTVSDKDPQKVRVWALCVPTTDLPVKQTYSQVG